jgi:hypothetical protein
MTDEERKDRAEWQAQFLASQQEMISKTICRLLAEERASQKDGGFSCGFCQAPATWYSCGVGACREHTPRAVELITVQGGLDRACRTVSAMAATYSARNALPNGWTDEMKLAEGNLLALRAREREMLAPPAEAQPSEAQANIAKARDLCLLRIRRVVEDWHVDNENDSLEAMRDIEQYLKEAP